MDINNNEILEADSEDPMIVVDQEEPADDAGLPNAHSAALVMAFIFLCVILYGVYRLCKAKCGKQKQQMSNSIRSQQQDIESGVEELEEYIKEREAYLAIYGPKKNINSISSTVSRTESSTVGP